MWAVLATHLFFFFSSRRRHTRLQGDWSSDVCSSDLNVGALKKRAARSLAPFAGFTNGSCRVSGTAIDTPPMASVRDGKMSNWSAGTRGTVWIGMLCADAVPATAKSTTERETTRLVMRHLAR